jgi:hypothetical protein
VVFISRYVLLDGALLLENSGYSTHSIMPYFYQHRIVCTLNSYSLPAPLPTARFNYQEFYMVFTLPLCVLYGSQNKQRIFSCTALTDWFLEPRWSVFTAGYGLDLYIQAV